MGIFHIPSHTEMVLGCIDSCNQAELEGRQTACLLGQNERKQGVVELIDGGEHGEYEQRKVRC
jgi:hypothetical protein